MKMVHWTVFVGLFGALIAACGGVLGWYFFPTVVHSKIEEGVVLEEGTEQYDRFLHIPQPLSFKVYLFNVTNVHKIQQGALPVVEEVGPYIYKQYRNRRVKQFSRDGSRVSYVQDYRFIFDEEASAPYKQSDTVTVLNMHMNAVLQIAENDPGLSLLLMHLNANIRGIFNNPKSMFVTTSVGQYLFEGVRFCINPSGMARAICKQIQEQGSRTIRVLNDGSLAFSLFNHKNQTGHEVYEVHTGRGNAMKLMEIQKLDDAHTLHIWPNSSDSETSICNSINGTDASGYPPFRERGQSLYIFSTEICRSVQLFYQQDVQYKGIPGFRYTTGDNFLNDIGPEYSNECFCVDKLTNILKRRNGCLYSGAMDLTTCLDAPVILTMPHMLGASNEYTKMIEGLKPDIKKHQTFVDIQYLTGIPLQGGKRVQFNMFLKSINKITLTENLTTVLMPVMWVDEGIQLNSESVQMFKSKLLSTLYRLTVIQWAILCGGLMTCIASVLFYFVLKAKPKEDVKVIK